MGCLLMPFADLVLQVKRMLGKHPPLAMFAAGGKTVQKFSEYKYKNTSVPLFVKCD